MSINDELNAQLARPWVRLLFWLLCAAILVFAFRQMLPVVRWVLNILEPFLIGLVLAYVFHPIVSFVQRRLRLGRVAGITLLGLAIAATLTGILVWLVPVLYEQVTGGIRDLSQAADRLIDPLTRGHFDKATRQQLREQFQTAMRDLDAFVRVLFTQLGGFLRPVAQGGLTTVRSVAGGVLTSLRMVFGFCGALAFVLIITFYYLVDMDRIPEIIRRLLPERHRERAWEILVEADHHVGGFMRGQLIDCLIIGALTSVLLIFAGLRQYAILIGFTAGLLNFVPYLGPVAGATPAMLWVLLTDRFTSWNERGLHELYLLLGFAAIQAIDGVVLQPLIVGKRAALHPLTVMLALAIGSRAGLGGMIVAVPVACCVRVLWLELFWQKRVAAVPGRPPRPRPARVKKAGAVTPAAGD